MLQAVLDVEAEILEVGAQVSRRDLFEILRLQQRNLFVGKFGDFCDEILAEQLQIAGVGIARQRPRRKLDGADKFRTDLRQFLQNLARQQQKLLGAMIAVIGHKPSL